jgi:hypothetical protein
MTMRRWLILGVLALTAGCSSSSTHSKPAAPVVASSTAPAVAKDQAAITMCANLGSLDFHTRAAAILKGKKLWAPQRAGYLRDRKRDITAVNAAAHQSRVPAIQQLVSSGADLPHLKLWCQANGLMP